MAGPKCRVRPHRIYLKSRVDLSLVNLVLSRRTGYKVEFEHGAGRMVNRWSRQSIYDDGTLDKM